MTPDVQDEELGWVEARYEDGGHRIVLRFHHYLSPKSLNQAYDYIKANTPEGLREMLVLCQDAEPRYEFSFGVDFGDRLGLLLARSNITIAVVTGDREIHFAIDAKIFNHRVPLGQFVQEQEAREWLSEKTAM